MQIGQFGDAPATNAPITIQGSLTATLRAGSSSIGDVLTIADKSVVQGNVTTSGTDGVNVGLSAAVSTDGQGRTIVTLTFAGSETDPVSALNGGVASLAHPAKLRRTQPLLSAGELARLVGEGFDAIEAWQWIPGGWGSRHYLGVATVLGVLVSGGSDDHGKRTADGAMRLGAQPVPPEVLEALRERAQTLRPR